MLAGLPDALRLAGLLGKAGTVIAQTEEFKVLSGGAVDCAPEGYSGQKIGEEVSNMLVPGADRPHWNDRHNSGPKE